MTAHLHLLHWGKREHRKNTVYITDKTCPRGDFNHVVSTVRVVCFHSVNPPAGTVLHNYVSTLGYLFPPTMAPGAGTQSAIEVPRFT